MGFCAVDFRTKLLVLFVALVVWMSAGRAQASVVITGTRVIYPEMEREVTVKLNNDGNTPALVQVWLDDGNPKTLPS